MSEVPQYQAQQQYTPQKSGTNVLAILSLIGAFIINIVGVILGIIALVQIKRTGQRGKGLAIAGIVIGALSIIIGIVVMVSVLGSLASHCADLGPGTHVVGGVTYTCS
ncbi:MULTISPECIES: DUF4190 domain-containing protein [Arthrobacter]|uniref:DUF4190 domain-containing protein n=2 Tax=Arthrobacter TaxID=1663 RepID=A0ABU9KPI6_9MICC|nr:DUF4190 domain-containing protein [Arthrobacter sp. YJM1]MDP5228721.1 DUF4190 domain-containing protein [Arthrobacter sp. YJM1]